MKSPSERIFGRALLQAGGELLAVGGRIPAVELRDRGRPARLMRRAAAQPPDACSARGLALAIEGADELLVHWFTAPDALATLVYEPAAERGWLGSAARAGADPAVPLVFIEVMNEFTKCSSSRLTSWLS